MFEPCIISIRATEYLCCFHITYGKDEDLWKEILILEKMKFGNDIGTVSVQYY